MQLKAGLTHSRSTLLHHFWSNKRLELMSPSCCSKPCQAHFVPVVANCCCRCGNPSGCCGLAVGCTPDDVKNLFPFGLCSLKYQYQVVETQANRSLDINAYYHATQVQRWPPWQVNGTTFPQTCKAFTAGTAPTVQFAHFGLQKCSLKPIFSSQLLWLCQLTRHTAASSSCHQAHSLADYMRR